jgi:hypothetical protein
MTDEVIPAHPPFVVQNQKLVKTSTKSLLSNSVSSISVTKPLEGAQEQTKKVNLLHLRNSDFQNNIQGPLIKSIEELSKIKNDLELQKRFDEMREVDALLSDLVYLKNKIYQSPQMLLTWNGHRFRFFIIKRVVICIQKYNGSMDVLVLASQVYWRLNFIKNLIRENAFKEILEVFIVMNFFFFFFFF